MHICAAEFQIGTALSLGEDEVHLWTVDLGHPEMATEAGEKWQQVLSADERSRAGRFRFARDRHCYTATRAILRMILAGYLGLDAKALVFSYSEKGKPHLNRDRSDGGRSSRVEFNVSHTGGTVSLLAFARERAVGVDVEQIRSNVEVESIARRFFSECEQQQFFALPESDRISGFYRCWTRKEAFIKALGSGLSLPLDQFDVSLAGENRNALLATRPKAEEAAEWSLREVGVDAGYVGALCVQGHGWQLRG